MSINITIIIIILTAVVSFAGFRNPELIDKLIFSPPDISSEINGIVFLAMD